ncbi:unnamed protein product [marine sediment metagenome]|uniref:Uncharacterized protein n=1 Tax=marine sediment metagenome TaxID=412755 RepID=X1ISF5_9ZZZZ
MDDRKAAVLKAGLLQRADKYIQASFRYAILRRFPADLNTLDLKSLLAYMVEKQPCGTADIQKAAAVGAPGPQPLKIDIL